MKLATSIMEAEPRVRAYNFPVLLMALWENEIAHRDTQWEGLTIQLEGCRGVLQSKRSCLCLVEYRSWTNPLRSAAADADLKVQCKTLS